MAQIFALKVTSIPDGCELYWGTSSSDITTVWTAEDYVQFLNTGVYTKLIRTADGAYLRLGTDYIASINAGTDIYTITENLNYCHFNGDGGIDVSLSLIPETAAGIDIVVGKTTFEGVTGVKYGGVNYSTVEVDGVTYTLSD